MRMIIFFFSLSCIESARGQCYHSWKRLHAGGASLSSAFIFCSCLIFFFFHFRNSQRLRQLHVLPEAPLYKLMSTIHLEYRCHILFAP